MDYRVSLVLTAVIAIYSILGGFVFQYLEEGATPPSNYTVSVPFPDDYSNMSTYITSDIGRNLSVLSEIFGHALDHYDGFDTWKVSVRCVFNETGLNIEASLEMDPIDPWSYYNALFFAESLITTVGFGNIAPKTTAGRLSACLYAVLGIPVVGVWMLGIGEFLLQAAKRMRARLTDNKERRRQIFFVQTITVFLIGSALFILFPAWLFMVEESWTYVDGFYFSVLTLLVVGLGDFVAGTDDNSPSWYRFFINFWLMFGLGWLSTLVSLALNMIKTRASKVAKQVEKVAVKTKEKIFADKPDWARIRRSVLLSRLNVKMQNILEEEESTPETTMQSNLTYDRDEKVSIVLSLGHSPAISRQGSVILPVEILIENMAFQDTHSGTVSPAHSGSRMSSRSSSFRSNGGHPMQQHVMPTISERVSKLSCKHHLSVPVMQAPRGSVTSIARIKPVMNGDVSNRRMSHSIENMANIGDRSRKAPRRHSRGSTLRTVLMSSIRNLTSAKNSIVSLVNEQQPTNGDPASKQHPQKRPSIISATSSSLQSLPRFGSDLKTVHRLGDSGDIYIVMKKPSLAEHLTSQDNFLTLRSKSDSL